MSSYLSIYASFKGDEKKHLLHTVSRSSELYTTLNDNLTLKFSYKDTIYNKVESTDLLSVLQSVKDDIDASEKRVYQYEKYAANNSSYIEEIITLKEYIQELNTIYSEIQLFFCMLDSDDYMSEVEALYITID